MASKQSAPKTKQEVFVEAITNAVVAAISRDIGSELADIKATLATIFAQQEVLTMRGAPAAHVPRGARKTGATTRSRKTPKSEEDKWAKCGNAMLWNRRMFAEDEKYRNKYFTPEVEKAVDADPSCKKHPKDSEKYYLAAGRFVWLKVWEADTRAEIKVLFKNWQEQRKLKALAAPLTADTAAAPASPNLLAEAQPTNDSPSTV